jgi:general secretion pathway protein G
MICPGSNPSPRRPSGAGRRPRGFTLVELLVVMLVLAVLIALLLPALNGALRTARNAAVGSEINQLSQALNAFKAKYGDYPPSRIYLPENGYFPVGSTIGLNTVGLSADITLGQLAQRSVAALRKFFPSVNFSTSQPVFLGNPPARWYDFNGNGSYDGAYILQGHQCLVFFLGGIPQLTGTTIGTSGFAKDPTNPFVNLSVSSNRQAPFFEFDSGRLIADNSSPYSALTGTPTPLVPSGFPGYLDSLGNIPGSGQINYYAYFSAYGNGGYDPNDVNFYDPNNPLLAEQDISMSGPIAIMYSASFPVTGVSSFVSLHENLPVSPPPNPYSSSLSCPQPQVTTYLNPQTFQIISSGVDGLYGLGGQYLANTTGDALPIDPYFAQALLSGGNVLLPYINVTERNIRAREKDNITNFHNGKLD